MAFFARQMDDYVRKLGIHIAAARPCQARSLTEEEARSEDRKDMAWRLFVLGAMGLFYLWLGLTAERPDIWPWLAGSVAVVGAVVAFTGWQRHQLRRGYRDPGISVDVADDGVVFSSPSGAWRHEYAEIRVPEVLSVATKSSRSFVGIVLDSPLGALRLENVWYRDGRVTAGAILKRLDELGLPAGNGD